MSRKRLEARLRQLLWLCVLCAFVNSVFSGFLSRLVTHKQFLASLGMSNYSLFQQPANEVQIP